MIGEMYLQYFELLLTEVEKVFKASHPSCDSAIRNWNLKEIGLFQDDLSNKVNGRISERWFYTHIKTKSNDKLPRTDVLDMLSQYAGFTDWNDFIRKNSHTPTEQTDKQVITKETLVEKKKKVTIMGVILIVVSVLIAIAAYFMSTPAHTSENELYQLSFIDMDTRKSIGNVELELLKPGESPEIVKTDTAGIIHFTKTEGKITFIVKAPYYRKDTIVRDISVKNSGETIQLKTDDYALMIHLFSKSKLQDWEKRRLQLHDMIADNAMIFQVYEKTQKGMELYDKTGFIDKLTMPLESLNNIKILNVEYKNGQIFQMRFTETQNQQP